MDIKIIDLFCGGGGFSRGFESQGLKINLAIDVNEHCEKTYTYNFKDTIFLRKDIRYVTSKEIKEIVGSEIDIIIGSPPCESFSAATVNRKKEPLERLYDDERGKLTLEFIRLVGNLKPKIFVMENVPQIMEGNLKKALEKEFKRAGYEKIYFNVLKAEKLGCPSRRARVFISNIKIKDVFLVKPKTVIEVIGDLPDPRQPNKFYNHYYIPISRERKYAFSKIKWEDSLRKYKDSKGRALGAFERLHPFKIAPSIKGQSRYIHPFDDRLLTVREQARLMSFPDTHIFIGSKEQQYDMIGEAVPPKMSEYIAAIIKKKVNEL